MKQTRTDREGDIAERGKGRKALVLLPIAVVLMLCAVPLAMMIDDNGTQDDGAPEEEYESPDDVIKIYSAEDLQNISDPAGNYVLMNDIDISELNSTSYNVSYSSGKVSIDNVKFSKGYMFSPVNGKYSALTSPNGTFTLTGYDSSCDYIFVAYSGDKQGITIEIPAGSDPFKTVRSGGNFEPLFQSEPFTGTFDGNGHRITGMEVSRVFVSAGSEPTGMIAYADGAVISNVIFEKGAVTVVTGGAAAQITAGNIVASGTAVIENCISRNPVLGTAETSSYDDYTNFSIGGMAGKGDFTMKGCRNYGGIATMTLSRPNVNIGGLIGTATALDITDCHNSGTVGFFSKDLNTRSVSVNVGGLIGSAGVGTMSKSSNNATVFAFSEDKGTGAAGGLIGKANMDKTATYTEMTECYNSGKVVEDGRYGTMGGLVGTGTYLDIRNSYNIGEIAHLNQSASGLYVAGVIGGETSNTRLVNVLVACTMDISGQEREVLSHTWDVLSAYAVNTYYNIQGTQTLFNYQVYLNGAFIKNNSGDGLKTVSQLKDPSTYYGGSTDIAGIGTVEGWDFTDVWRQDTDNLNGGFPFLKDNPPDVDVFDMHPRSQDVNVGDDAEFNVTAAGGTTPAGYQWQCDDGSGWKDIGGATDTLYRVTADADMNGNMYRCVATVADVEYASDAAALNVKYVVTIDLSDEYGTVRWSSPSISGSTASVTPMDIRVPADEDLTFTAEASAGNVFAHWRTGSGNYAGTTFTIEAGERTALTAVFGKSDQYRGVNINIDGTGTVSWTDGEGTQGSLDGSGQILVKKGSAVDMISSADAYWTVGQDAFHGNEASIPEDVNNVTVTFGIPDGMTAMDIIIDGDGTVTYDDGTNTGKVTETTSVLVAEGRNVTLTSSSDAYWSIDAMSSYGTTAEAAAGTSVNVTFGIPDGMTAMDIIIDGDGIVTYDDGTNAGKVTETASVLVKDRTAVSLTSSSDAFWSTGGMSSYGSAAEAAAGTSVNVTFGIPDGMTSMTITVIGNGHAAYDDGVNSGTVMGTANVLVNESSVVSLASSKDAYWLIDGASTYGTAATASAGTPVTVTFGIPQGMVSMDITVNGSGTLTYNDNSGHSGAVTRTAKVLVTKGAGITLLTDEDAYWSIDGVSTFDRHASANAGTPVEVTFGVPQGMVPMKVTIAGGGHVDYTDGVNAGMLTKTTEILVGYGSMVSFTAGSDAYWSIGGIRHYGDEAEAMAGTPVEATFRIPAGMVSMDITVTGDGSVDYDDGSNTGTVTATTKILVGVNSSVSFTSDKDAYWSIGGISTHGSAATAAAGIPVKVTFGVPEGMAEMQITINGAGTVSYDDGAGSRGSVTGTAKVLTADGATVTLTSDKDAYWSIDGAVMNGRRASAPAGTPVDVTFGIPDGMVAMQVTVIGTGTVEFDNSRGDKGTFDKSVNILVAEDSNVLFMTDTVAYWRLSESAFSGRSVAVTAGDPAEVTFGIPDGMVAMTVTIADDDKLIRYDDGTNEGELIVTTTILVTQGSTVSFDTGEDAYWSIGGTSTFGTTAEAAAGTPVDVKFAIPQGMTEMWIDLYNEGTVHYSDGVNEGTVTENARVLLNEGSTASVWTDSDAYWIVNGEFMYGTGITTPAHNMVHVAFKVIDGMVSMDIVINGTGMVTFDDDEIFAGWTTKTTKILVAEGQDVSLESDPDAYWSIDGTDSYGMTATAPSGTPVEVTFGTPVGMKEMPIKITGTGTVAYSDGVNGGTVNGTTNILVRDGSKVTLTSVADAYWSVDGTYTFGKKIETDAGMPVDVTFGIPDGMVSMHIDATIQDGDGIEYSDGSNTGRITGSAMILVNENTTVGFKASWNSFWTIGGIDTSGTEAEAPAGTDVKVIVRVPADKISMSIDINGTGTVTYNDGNGNTGVLVRSARVLVDIGSMVTLTSDDDAYWTVSGVSTYGRELKAEARFSVDVTFGVPSGMASMDITVIGDGSSHYGDGTNEGTITGSTRILVNEGSTVEFDASRNAYWTVGDIRYYGSEASAPAGTPVIITFTVPDGMVSMDITVIGVGSVTFDDGVNKGTVNETAKILTNRDATVSLKSQEAYWNIGGIDTYGITAEASAGTPVRVTFGVPDGMVSMNITMIGDGTVHYSDGRNAGNVTGTTSILVDEGSTVTYSASMRIHWTAGDVSMYGQSITVPAGTLVTATFTVPDGTVSMPVTVTGTGSVTYDDGTNKGTVTGTTEILVAEGSTVTFGSQADAYWTIAGVSTYGTDASAPAGTPVFVTFGTSTEMISMDITVIGDGSVGYDDGSGSTGSVTTTGKILVKTNSNVSFTTDTDAYWTIDGISTYGTSAEASAGTPVSVTFGVPAGTVSMDIIINGTGTVTYDDGVNRETISETAKILVAEDSNVTMRSNATAYWSIDGMSTHGAKAEASAGTPVSVTFGIPDGKVPMNVTVVGDGTVHYSDGTDEGSIAGTTRILVTADSTVAFTSDAEAYWSIDNVSTSGTEAVAPAGTPVTITFGIPDGMTAMDIIINGTGTVTYYDGNTSGSVNVSASVLVHENSNIMLTSSEKAYWIISGKSTFGDRAATTAGTSVNVTFGVPDGMAAMPITIIGVGSVHYDDGNGNAGSVSGSAEVIVTADSTVAFTSDTDAYWSMGGMSTYGNNAEAPAGTPVNVTFRIPSGTMSMDVTITGDGSVDYNDGINAGTVDGTTKILVKIGSTVAFTSSSDAFWSIGGVSIYGRNAEAAAGIPVDVRFGIPDGTVPMDITMTGDGSVDYNDGMNTGTVDGTTKILVKIGSTVAFTSDADAFWSIDGISTYGKNAEADAGIPVNITFGVPDGMVSMQMTITGDGSVDYNDGTNTGAVGESAEILVAAGSSVSFASDTDAYWSIDGISTYGKNAKAFAGTSVSVTFGVPDGMVSMDITISGDGSVDYDDGVGKGTVNVTTKILVKDGSNISFTSDRDAFWSIDGTNSYGTSATASAGTPVDVRFDIPEGMVMMPVTINGTGTVAYDDGANKGTIGKTGSIMVDDGATVSFTSSSDAYWSIDGISTYGTVAAAVAETPVSVTFGIPSGMVTMPITINGTGTVAYDDGTNTGTVTGTAEILVARNSTVSFTSDTDAYWSVGGIDTYGASATASAGTSVNVTFGIPEDMVEMSVTMVGDGTVTYDDGENSGKVTATSRILVITDSTVSFTSDRNAYWSIGGVDTDGRNAAAAAGTSVNVTFGVPDGMVAMPITVVGEGIVAYDDGSSTGTVTETAEILVARNSTISFTSDRDAYWSIDGISTFGTTSAATAGIPVNVTFEVPDGMTVTDVTIIGEGSVRYNDGSVQGTIEKTGKILVNRSSTVSFESDMDAHWAIGDMNIHGNSAEAPAGTAVNVTFGIPDGMTEMEITILGDGVVTYDDGTNKGTINGTSSILVVNDSKVSLTSNRNAYWSIDGTSSYGMAATAQAGTPVNVIIRVPENMMPMSVTIIGDGSVHYDDGMNAGTVERSTNILVTKGSDVSLTTDADAYWSIDGTSSYGTAAKASAGIPVNVRFEIPDGTVPMDITVVGEGSVRYSDGTNAGKVTETTRIFVNDGSTVSFTSSEDAYWSIDGISTYGKNAKTSAGIPVNITFGIPEGMVTMPITMVGNGSVHYDDGVNNGTVNATAKILVRSGSTVSFTSDTDAYWSIGGISTYGKNIETDAGTPVNVTFGIPAGAVEMPITITGDGNVAYDDGKGRTGSITESCRILVSKGSTVSFTSSEDAFWSIGGVSTHGTAATASAGMSVDITFGTPQGMTGMDVTLIGDGSVDYTDGTVKGKITKTSSILVNEGSTVSFTSDADAFWSIDGKMTNGRSAAAPAGTPVNITFGTPQGMTAMSVTISGDGSVDYDDGAGNAATIAVSTKIIVSSGSTVSFKSGTDAFWSIDNVSSYGMTAEAPAGTPVNVTFGVPKGMMSIDIIIDGIGSVKYDDGIDSGNIMSSGKILVAAGSDIGFEAVDIDGNRFTHWTFDGSIMTAHAFNAPAKDGMAVKATFMPAADVNGITVNVDGKGMVTWTVVSTGASGSTGSGSTFSAPSDSEVTFTASPSNGSAFIRWTVSDGRDAVGDGTAAMTFASDATVTSEFVEGGTYDVKIVSEHGSVGWTYVSGDGAVVAGTSSFSVPAGTEVTFTSSPDDGFKFKNWIMGTKGYGDNPCTYTVVRSITATAEYGPEGNMADVRVIMDDVGSIAWKYDNVSGTSLEFSVPVGTEVTFTAIPDDGHMFLYWTVNGDDRRIGDATARITIDGDTDIEAVFVSAEDGSHQRIDLTVMGNGSVGWSYVQDGKTVNGQTDISACIAIPTGLDITFEATDGDLIRWALDSTDMGDSVEFAMDAVNADHKLEAVFQATRNTVTVSVTGNGTVDWICGDNVTSGTIDGYGTITVPKGSEVTLTARAADGNAFRYWVADGEYLGDSVYKAVPIENMGVDAYFEPIGDNDLCEVTVNAGNGSVSWWRYAAEGITVNGSGTFHVPAGVNVEFTDTPDAGFEFLYWTCSDIGSIADNPYERSFSADTVMTAVYASADSLHTVYITGDNGRTEWSYETADGTVRGSAGQFKMPHDTELVLNMIPDDGYGMQYWSIDGECSAENPGSITVTGDTHIDVTFTRSDRLLQVAILGTDGGSVQWMYETNGNTITGDSAFSVPRNTDVTFTAIPDEDHGFAEWTGIMSDVNPATQRITSSLKLTALFERTAFTITITADNGMDVSPSGTVKVQVGEDLTVTFNPKDGYEVSEVRIDGNGHDELLNGAEYTFADIHGDHVMTFSSSTPSAGLPAVVWMVILMTIAEVLVITLVARFMPRKR